MPLKPVVHEVKIDTLARTNTELAQFTFPLSTAAAANNFADVLRDVVVSLVPDKGSPARPQINIALTEENTNRFLGQSMLIGQWERFETRLTFERHDLHVPLACHLGDNVKVTVRYAGIEEIEFKGALTVSLFVEQLG